MKKFLVLVKKEIKELITPQMIIPLVVMVLLFSFIGNLMSKETAKIAAPQPIWIIDQDNTEVSSKIAPILTEANFNTTILDYDDIDRAVSQAKENNIPSLLIIPAGFERGIKEFQMQEIATYKIVSSFSMLSSAKYSVVDGAMKIINNYFSNEWIKNKNVNIVPDVLKNPIKSNEFVVVNKNKANISLATVMGFIQKQTFFIPIIFFLVIIMASQMVAVAVANEKENKTFETLLSSPINRKTIVFAKLIGAGIVAILSAGFYMIGFSYYMKGLIGGAASSVTEEALATSLESLGITIGVGQYVLLGLSLFMGILVALSIAMILGTLVENVKSVQSAITPLMILVLLPYLLVLFLDINTMSPIIKYIIYAIPFAHCFLAAQKILMHDYLFVVYGIIYQFIIFIIFVVLAAKIFSSDKIITLRLRWRKKKQ